ncbi:MAG: LysM peptidoglycan-binding domain-containing protein [Peptococcaceae bacterium]|nr:LysM peptidoglycan-binding domain-containing protein [Peptococcaceae bacterium]
MDIYITEKKSGRKIQIPVVPQEITSGSDGRFAQYDIMKRGEVRVSEGRYLLPVSWEGIFPGESRKNEPWVKKWTDPKELDEIFTQWRDNGELLKLVITDTNINMDCKVATYKPTESGGYGDIAYSVTFIEHVDLLVVTTKNASASSGSSSKGSGGGKGKTYTVKSGDCLWNIAQMPDHYGKGSEWIKIYNANKDIIEKEAKRRGKAHSDKGYWIYPGTTLTIP